ncbi:unnamed protein product [Mytilus coruscus]|uniref:Uncharacterized protein n=1 Tax=Mytilus coruscus TaxID=42192 RepID=A0A6J8E9V8_MYTCO|nr:unnamed protein product [Mytilus coruscus]
MKGFLKYLFNSYQDVSIDKEVRVDILEYIPKDLGKYQNQSSVCLQNIIQCKDCSDNKCQHPAIPDDDFAALKVKAVMPVINSIQFLTAVLSRVEVSIDILGRVRFSRYAKNNANVALQSGSIMRKSNLTALQELTLNADLLRSTFIDLDRRLKAKNIFKKIGKAVKKAVKKIGSGLKKLVKKWWDKLRKVFGIAKNIWEKIFKKLKIKEWIKRRLKCILKKPLQVKCCVFPECCTSVKKQPWLYICPIINNAKILLGRKKRDADQCAAKCPVCKINQMGETDSVESICQLDVDEIDYRLKRLKYLVEDITQAINVTLITKIEVDDSTLTQDSDTVNRAFEKSKVTYTINGTDVVFEPNKPFSVTDRELTAEMLSTEIKRKVSEVSP